MNLKSIVWSTGFAVLLTLTSVDAGPAESYSLVSYFTPTPFPSVSASPSPSGSPIATPAVSLTPFPSPTTFPTATPISTPVPTLAPTPVPSLSPTPSPSPTQMPTPSPTPTPFACALDVNARWNEVPQSATRGWIFDYRVTSAVDPMVAAQFFTFHGPVNSEVQRQSTMQTVSNLNQFSFSTTNPAMSGASNRWRLRATVYHADGRSASCESVLFLNDPPAPPSRSCTIAVSQEGRGIGGIFWEKNFQQAIALSSGTPASADRLVVTYKDSEGRTNEAMRNGPINQFSGNLFPPLVESPRVGADGFRQDYNVDLNAKFYLAGQSEPVSCSISFQAKNPNREFTCVMQVYQKRNNQELSDFFWGNPYGARVELQSRIGSTLRPTSLKFTRTSVTACANQASSWTGVVSPVNPFPTYFHDNLESRNLPAGCVVGDNGRLKPYSYDLKAEYFYNNVKIASCGPLRFEVKNPLPNELMDLNVYMSPAEIKNIIAKVIALVRADPALQQRLRGFLRGGNVGESDSDIYGDYAFIKDLVIQAINEQGAIIREIWSDVPYFNVTIHVPSDTVHAELGQAFFNMACSNQEDLVAQGYARFPVRFCLPRRCPQRIANRMARIRGVVAQACAARSGGPVWDKVNAGVSSGVSRMLTFTNNELKNFYNRIDLRSSAQLRLESSAQIAAQYVGTQTLARITRTATGARLHQFECSLLNKYGQCAIDSLASFVQTLPR